MLFFNKKSPEEIIIEFAKKHYFDVYPKPNTPNAYYLVNDTYTATPKIEDKITSLEEILSKRTKKNFKLISLNPNNVEEPRLLGECIYKRPIDS